MESWKKYFTITGCNKFVMPGVGLIDSSNKNIAVDKLKKAYDKKCPFVGLTDAGRKKFDPESKPIAVKILKENKEETVTKSDKNKSKNKKPE